MKHFCVPNLEKLRHYKSHKSPWIKLHKREVGRSKFIALSDVDKAHLMLIWSLANEKDNRLPYNPEWVKYAIKVTYSVDLDLLVKHGFIEIIK